MDMHESDLAAAHRAANGDIEAAQGRWVGASGAALQTKFAEWQETTARLSADLAAHGAAFAAAADGYASVDDSSAKNLDHQF
jgi:uncharacterized protein YukE